jgi:glycosyltransferase involved in cell wall biosynthesis
VTGVQTCALPIFGLAKSKKIELFIELTRWGFTPWLLDENMHDGLVGDIMKYSRPPIDQNGNRIICDVSLQLILPNEWDPSIAKYNVGLTAGVESDKCNPLWIDACRRMDMMIVPTEHVKKTFLNSGGADLNIHVIHESYFDELVSEEYNSELFDFDTSFNYLLVGQLTSPNPDSDRKNLMNTIKYICEVHAGDSDVGIIVKMNCGRATLIDRNESRERLNALLKQFRRGESPKVHLVHGDMTNKELTSLYKHPSIKAFVTLTRGEGFGLPILESAVAGIPVIATDWSGHLDFLNKGKFIKVGYTLEQIPKERIDNMKEKSMNIWIEGSKWATPSFSNFKEALKKFRKSPEIPKTWAIELSEKLKVSHSFVETAKLYDSLLLDKLI